METLLAGTADDFQEGSIKIAYEGTMMQLGAQIKLADPAKNLIWAEQFVYTAKFASSRLENLWYLPYSKVDTSLVVSNTSSATITATITVDGTYPNQDSPEQVTLAPWETRVLDIMADLVGNPNGEIHDKGGISITHTGAPGAVLARMFISKPNKGYSVASNLIDPETTVSQHWHGNGLRFKNLNGNKLEPILAVRNLGDQTSRIKGKIFFTRPNGNMDSINIREKAVLSGNTRLIDLRELIGDIPNAVQYGGIELEYDTPKGTIITSLQSASQNGDHVFQVPMFDPSALPSSAGGFPWKADGDFRSIVYIKNETSIDRSYTAHLLYNGGQYSLGVKEIKPHQTVAVDFRAVRDAQTPDSIGRIIPLNIETGQIAWSVKGGDNKVLSGRSEQISVENGVTSTYACYNCCPDSVYQTEIIPSSIQLAFGATEFMASQQTDISCFGTYFGPYTPSAVLWDSDNVNVATIDQGYLFGAGAGTATISATWDTCLYWLEGGNCSPVCDQTTQYASVGVAPIITSITPTKGSVGGKISVSIDGNGFTPTTAIVPISGITFSAIQRFGSTSIVATFTIDGNAGAGNKDVKVTDGGVTSNAKPFFVQIPEKARRDHTAATVVLDPGPGNIVNPFGQVIATGRCGAYRNFKYTLTDQNDEVLNLGLVDEEIGLTVTEILSDIQVNPSGVPHPVPKTVLTNNVAMFGDILASYQTPPCPPPFSIVLTQKFKVTVGQTIFNLSTENLLEITRSGPGQWTIISTNQAP